MLEETAQIWKRQAETAGMRELLLQQMSARFGRLPAGVRLKVQSITSKQEIRKLGRKFAVAKSLQELGL
jgi:hypothetical protein